MALPGQTWTSFSAVGNREDLSEIIYDITPTETPFLSAAAKDRATAVYHEWQTDALDPASPTNAALEGDDATGATAVPTTRVGNYCQISEKTVIVSGTQRAVDSAGRADEYSYQTMKRGKELKRDMEAALTQNNGSSAGGIGTARVLASLESWLSTNATSVGTGTAQTTPGFSAGTVAAPTDSSVQGAFTKTSLDAVMQDCWTQGGQPTVVLCGPSNRTVASGFAGISELQTPASPANDTTLMGAIDIYKSNFGSVRITPSRFCRDRTVQVLDMEYLGVSMLRDMVVTPLGKTGDNDKAQLICEYTLCVKNEAASGKIADCTTP